MISSLAMGILLARAKANLFQKELQFYKCQLAIEKEPNQKFQQWY